MKTLKQFNLGIIAMLILPLLLDSCVVSYYKSGRKNMPGLEEKGDFNVGVNINSKSASAIGLAPTDSGLNKNRIDGHISYSPAENLGLSLNTNTNVLNLRSIFGSVFDIPLLNSRFYELNVGYYKNLTPSILFEVYGFGGFGNITPHWQDFGNVNISQNRFGVNSGVTFGVKNWSFGLHTGITRHSFEKQLFTDLFPEDEFVGSSTLLPLEDRTSLRNTYVESAFTIRYKIKDICQLETQWGRTNRIGSDDFLSDLSYHRKNFSLGAIFDIQAIMAQANKK